MAPKNTDLLLLSGQAVNKKVPEILQQAEHEGYNQPHGVDVVVCL